MIDAYNIADERLEALVLGQLISESEAIHRVDKPITPDLFTTPTNEAAARAVLSLREKAKRIDLMTVTSELKALGLDKECAPTDLVSMTSSVGTTANLEDHIELLRIAASRRALRSAGADLMKGAIDETLPVEDLINNHSLSISSIEGATIPQDSTLSINQAFDQLHADFQAVKKSGGLVGIPTGLQRLDSLTGGFRKEELVIIAARPGMGKTALVCSVAYWMAKNGFKTVFSTLEMSAKQLQARITSNALDVPFLDINQSRLSSDQWRDDVVARLHEINGVPLSYIDKGGISIEELRNRLRKIQREKGLDVVIIDYLQLLTTRKRSNTRNDEVAYISRSLKALAKELKVPIICLAQLSRAVETRGGDKMPQLSDLRDSGQLEQDADFIGFLNRPAYYGITEDAEGQDIRDLCLMNVAKHRNGETRVLKLKFEPDYMRFEDWRNEIQTRSVNNGANTAI